MKLLKSFLCSLDWLNRQLLHNLAWKQTLALKVYIFLVNAAVASPCPVGFMPPDCTQQCKDGFYGAKCLSPCSGSCSNQTCRPQTGECYRCRVGFVGIKCSQKCSRGAYGQDCNMTCPLNCLDNDCDPFTGNCNQCLQGFSGITCEDIETGEDRIARGDLARRHKARRELSTKPISGNTVLYIVIVSVSFSVPVCAIACWWWFLKKKIKEISGEKHTQPIYRPPGRETDHTRKGSRSHKQRRDHALRYIHKNTSDAGDRGVQSGFSHGGGERFNKDSPARNIRSRLENSEYQSVERGDHLERDSKIERQYQAMTEQISPDKDSTQNMEEMSKVIEENKPLDLQRAANYSQNLFFKTRPEGTASKKSGQLLDKSVKSFESWRDVHDSPHPELRVQCDARRGLRNDNHVDDADDMRSGEYNYHTRSGQYNNHMRSGQYNNHMRARRDQLPDSGKSGRFTALFGRIWNKLKRGPTQRQETPLFPVANFSSKSLMADLDKHNGEDIRLATKDTMTSSDFGKWTKGTITETKALNFSPRDHSEAVYNQTTEPLHMDKAGNMTKVQDIGKFLGLSNKLRYSTYKAQMQSSGRISETKHSTHDSRFSNDESCDQRTNDRDKTSTMPTSSHLLRLINAKASEIFSRQIAGHTARRRRRPNEYIRREHSCPDVSLVSNEDLGLSCKPPTSVPMIATQQTRQRDNWGGKPSSSHRDTQSPIYHTAESGPRQEAVALLPQNQTQSVKYFDTFETGSRNLHQLTASEKLHANFQDHSGTLQSCAKIDGSCTRPGQMFPPQNYRLFPTNKYPLQSMSSMRQIVVADTTELSNVYSAHPQSPHCNTLFMSSFSGQAGIWRDACQRTAPVWNHITLLNPAAALGERKSELPRDSQSCDQSLSDNSSQSDCSQSYDVERCETHPKHKPGIKAPGSRTGNNSLQSKAKAKYQIVNETGPSNRIKSPRSIDRLKGLNSEENTQQDKQPSNLANDNALISSQTQKIESKQSKDNDKCRKPDGHFGDHVGDVVVHNSNLGELSDRVSDKAVDTDVSLQVHYYLKDLLQLSAHSAPCNFCHIPYDFRPATPFTDTECSLHARDRLRYEFGNIMGLTRSHAYADSLYRYQSPRTFTTEIGTQIGSDTSQQGRELINRAAGPDDEDIRNEKRLKSKPRPQSFDISTQVYCTKPMKYSSKKKVKDGRGNKQKKHDKQGQNKQANDKQVKCPKPLMASKSCYVRTGRATSPDRRTKHQSSAEKPSTSKDSGKKKPMYHVTSFSETTSSTGQLPVNETKELYATNSKKTMASSPKRSRTHEKSTNQSASNCLSGPVSSISEQGEGSELKESIKIQPIKIIRVRVEPETDRNMADFEHLEKVKYTEDVGGNSTNSSNGRASSESESSEFFSSWKTLSVQQKEKLLTASSGNTSKEPDHWLGKERHVSHMDDQSMNDSNIIKNTSQIDDASQICIHNDTFEHDNYTEETNEGFNKKPESSYRSDFWRGRNLSPFSNVDGRSFWNRKNTRIDVDFKGKDSPRHRFYRSEPGRSAVASGRVTSPITNTSNKSPTNSHMGRNLPMGQSTPPLRESFAAPMSRFLSTWSLQTPSESPAGSRMTSEYSRKQYPPVAEPRSSMFPRYGNNVTSSTFKDVYKPIILGTPGSMFTGGSDTWGAWNETNTLANKKSRFWERKIESNKCSTNYDLEKAALLTSRDRVQHYSEDDSSWSMASRQECRTKEDNDEMSDEDSSDETMSSRSKSTSTDVKKTETTTQRETPSFSAQPLSPVRIEAKYPRFSYTAKPLPRGLVGASKCSKGNFSPQMDYRRGMNNFHYILKSPKSLRTPPGSPEAALGQWDTPMRNWKKVSNQVDYPVPSLLEDAVELTKGRVAIDAKTEGNDKEETTEDTRGTRTLRSPYSSEDFREQYSKVALSRASHTHDSAGSKYHGTVEPDDGQTKDKSRSESGKARIKDVVRVVVDTEADNSTSSKNLNTDRVISGQDYSLPAVGKLDKPYYSSGKPASVYSTHDDLEPNYHKKRRNRSDSPEMDRKEMAHSVTSRSHAASSGRQDNTFPLMNKTEAAYNFPNKSEMSPPYTRPHDELHRTPQKRMDGYPVRGPSQVVHSTHMKPGVYNSMTASETQHLMTDNIDARQQNPTYHTTNTETAYPPQFNPDNTNFRYPMNHMVHTANCEHGTACVHRNQYDSGYPVPGTLGATYNNFNGQGVPREASQGVPHEASHGVHCEASYPWASEQVAPRDIVNTYGANYPTFNGQGFVYPYGPQEVSFPRASEQGDVNPVNGFFYPGLNDQGAVYPSMANMGNSSLIKGNLETVYITMNEHEFHSHPVQKSDPLYHFQNNVEPHPEMMTKATEKLPSLCEENGAVYQMQKNTEDAFSSGAQNEELRSQMSKNEPSCHTKCEAMDHNPIVEEESYTHKQESASPAMKKHTDDHISRPRDATHPPSLISEPVRPTLAMPDDDYPRVQNQGASYPLSGQSKAFYVGVGHQKGAAYGSNYDTRAPVRRRHDIFDGKTNGSDLLNSNSKGQILSQQSSIALSNVDKQPPSLPTLIVGVDKDTETASINWGVGNGGVTGDVATPSHELNVFGQVHDPHNITTFSQGVGCSHSLPNTSSDRGKRPRARHALASARDAKRDEEVTEFKSVIEEELFYDAMDAKEFVALKNKRSSTDKTFGQSESKINKILDAARRKLKPVAKSLTSSPVDVLKHDLKDMRGKFAMRFAASESGESTSVSRKSSGRRLTSVFRLGRAEDKKESGNTEKSNSGDTRVHSKSQELTSEKARRSKRDSSKTKKEKFFDLSQPAIPKEKKSTMVTAKQKSATSNDGPDRREHVHFEHKKCNYSPSFKEIFYDAA